MPELLSAATAHGRIAGHIAPFDRRLEAQRAGLFRYALRLTNNRSDADDLTQETLVRAYDRRASYRGSQKRDGEQSPAAPLATSAENENSFGNDSDRGLRAWLFTILKNIFVNQYHRRRAHKDDVELDETLLPATDLSPEDELLRHDEMTRLFTWLDRLPSESRRVVLLAGVENLPYDEIAAKLGVPIGTVRSRLFRARARLERNLGIEARGARN